MTTVIDLIPCLADYDAAYPADLLAARRAAFVEQIKAANADPFAEQRLAAIDAALGQTLDTETINNLLEEKADILISLGEA